MGSMQPSFDLFHEYYNTINGELSRTEHTRHGINPATGQANPEVPVSTPKDVDNAVEAGKKAFRLWSRTSYQDRKKQILAFADGIQAHGDEFANLLTQEQGKPTPFAQGEIRTSVDCFRAFSKLEWREEIIEENDTTQTILRHTPLGVVVGIVPWNFPLHLACQKIAGALLTGNVIIIKPSPFTPYCGLKLGELSRQYLPPGVLQVLSGDDNLGPWLTAHPGTDKISFTGSTSTGKKVMETAAKTLKRVTLELGGKDPAIICSSVDISKAAERVVSLAFANSGQICIAIKRIYVHEDIYQPFKEALAEWTEKLKIGRGDEEGVIMGPVQNSMQYERVKTFFSDIEKNGHNIVVGGTPSPIPDGYFITPTIIDKPTEDSRIVIEEPFGPILPLLTWKDEEDVIDRANDTPMGLGASVWSNDLTEAARIARQLEAGMVWINGHMEAIAEAPFGGHKQSGIGYEGGVGGLRQFCNAQALYLKKVVT